MEYSVFQEDIEYKQLMPIPDGFDIYRLIDRRKDSDVYDEVLLSENGDTPLFMVLYRLYGIGGEVYNGVGLYCRNGLNYFMLPEEEFVLKPYKDKKEIIRRNLTITNNKIMQDFSKSDTDKLYAGLDYAHPIDGETEQLCKDFYDIIDNLPDEELRANLEKLFMRCECTYLKWGFYRGIESDTNS